MMAYYCTLPPVITSLASFFSRPRLVKRSRFKLLSNASSSFRHAALHPVRWPSRGSGLCARVSHSRVAYAGTTSLSTSSRGMLHTRPLHIMRSACTVHATLAIRVCRLLKRRHHRSRDSSATSFGSTQVALLLMTLYPSLALVPAT